MFNAYLTWLQVCFRVDFEQTITVAEGVAHTRRRVPDQNFSGS